MKINKKLKALIKSAKDKSVYGLAKHLGIAQQSGEYLVKKKDLNYEFTRLKETANYLGVEMWQILDGIKEEDFYLDGIKRVRVKRYFAFYGDSEPIKEGMRTFLDDFSTLEEAIKAIEQANKTKHFGSMENAWGLVYDIKEKEHVYKVGNC